MKKVLITGASSGIGLATAEKMHAQGWQVHGIARSFAADTEGWMQCHKVDLAQIDALPKALSELKQLNDIDCLVLNAGKGLFGGLEQFSHQQIRSTVDLNLLSNIYLIKHFLPAFKKQGGKDIILMGSESSIQGAKQGAVYCATKFALRGLAQSLRADCTHSDVRVMLVNPGPVDTSFFDKLHFEPQQGEDYALDPNEVAEVIINALNMPRNTVQEEILLQPMKRAFNSVKRSSSK